MGPEINREGEQETTQPLTPEQQKMLEVIEDARDDILAGVVTTLALVAIQPETGEKCTKTAYIYDGRGNLIQLIGALELLKAKVANRCMGVQFKGESCGFETEEE